MNKVRILSPEIVSKIAAGEVIERPASVVKELIENSLDANSTSIEIRLKDAGKLLIAVKDNGHGIEQDDLKKIFFRHATSKIQQADDLYHIDSLGFRGEALYSIGAIADVIVRSKTEKQDSGWEIHVRADKQLDVKPCTFGSSGTEIEIKELFFNTPARKKFLKSNTTEMHQILNTVIPYTLLYHSCRFTLKSQTKTILDLAPTKNKIDRVADVLNLEKEFILESSQAFEEHNLAINLIAGDINIKRGRRDMQFIFVNGRPVQNKSISFHLNQIYRLILPEDIFPFFAVSIKIPSDQIDVNIHPTKREVKLKNERLVCDHLRAMCEETIMSQGKTKLATNLATSKIPIEHRTSTNSVINRAIEKSNMFETATEPSSWTTSTDDYAYPKSETQETFIPQDNVFKSEDSLQNKIENARYIGPFRAKFLLFESENSLLVMDQHAAAERITYEQLIRQMNNSSIEIQNLLSPIVIKLSPQETLIYEDVKDELLKMGFESNQWDEESIAIHSQPTLLKDVEKAVRYILAGERIEKSDFATLARRACRSSIMTGDKLASEQAEFLREQLLQCLDPFTCPHGRPTVIEMSENFLDKQFLRT